jgi:hypothetical protein
MKRRLAVSTPVSGVREVGHHGPDALHDVGMANMLSRNCLTPLRTFGTVRALMQSGFSEGGHGA